MTTPAETADDSREGAGEQGSARPGLVVVFSGGKATWATLPLGREPVLVGRDALAEVADDERLSRSHCTVALSARGWVVQDLGSKNGTFLDGVPVSGEVVALSPVTLRAGGTILLPCPDVSRFAPVATEGSVLVGSRLRHALAAVDRAATSATLLLSGESGTGKELAARRFHAMGPAAKGPFVAINCATIPEGLAERLLFGAKRGAYSGATEDVIGLVRAADGGVLFLDEVAELDAAVQTKLLRTIETKEVMPLGSTRAVGVDVRVCAATHVPLRRAVADGRFRADLYHRLAPPEVTLPPLRERLDELPHHVARELAASGGLAPQARLIEACLLRAWPGNVRELGREVRDAAGRAVAEKADRVRLDHLSPSAGQPLSPPSSRRPGPDKVRPYVRHGERLTRADLERALAAHDGNVTRAARSLGLQRTQLYRELERHSIEPSAKRG